MQKPIVDLGGSKSIIMSIEKSAIQALQDAGLTERANELAERLKRPDLSRFQFLKIVQEYVELV